MFEWYQDPEQLLEHLQKYVQNDGRDLIVGPGNSNLATFMTQNGFESVTAIDFAKLAVVKSWRSNHETEGITWKVIDILKMTFSDGDFQGVVDKGCIDCLFFAGETDALLAFTEIARVLKGRGVSLYISYSPPEVRRDFFKPNSSSPSSSSRNHFNPTRRTPFTL